MEKACNAYKTLILTEGFNTIVYKNVSVHLKSDSHLPKKICFICFNDSPSKMMKNGFLFHLKSSFRSQDI